MSKKLLVKSLMTLVLALPAIVSAVVVVAPSPPDSGAPPDTMCSKEILLTNFPIPIVNDVLKRYQIPQDKWENINKALQEHDKEIFTIVEKDAAALDPNPLTNPQQNRMILNKLIDSAVAAVFSKALKDNGVTDESKFQQMLNDIKQERIARYSGCVKRQTVHMNK